MIKRNFVAWIRITRLFFLLFCGVSLVVATQLAAQAASTPAPQGMRSTTNAQRKAAAARAAQRRVTEHHHAAQTRSQAQKSGVGQNTPVPLPLTLDQLYFGTYPNFANSPLPQTDVNGVVLSGGIRKFVDTLPGLNAPNNLGQQIPVAVPDQTKFPGSDYYEIAVVQYQEKMHSDLQPTTLRGYVQLNALTVMQPHYLGPLIVAQKDVPVRIKFVNLLQPGTGGDLFIPVDTTVMGAGMGPDGMSSYLQNRATLHLHGGNTPWISDGTPHQWTVPAGDSATTYPKGVSTQYVPDMFFDQNGKVAPVPKCDVNITTNCWPTAVPAGLSNNPGPGAMTFYYTNQQSARLMFYHDHSYGITRLNVYAGEAAGYLLQDQTEAALVAAGTIPNNQIPLVIQDKTFVPPNPAVTQLYSVAMLAGGANYNVATTTLAIDPLALACSVQPTGVPVIGDFLEGFGKVDHNAILSVTLTNKGTCTSSPDIVFTDTAAVPGTGAAAFGSLATLAQQDPTWDPTLWGGEGNLWFPHVYMPNQYPDNPDGSNMNMMGRLDYGMWFWPPMVVGPPGTGQLIHGDVACPTAALPAQRCPGFPAVGNPDPTTGTTVSLLPEAFMDTPVVNGTAYPTVTVPAGAVRFRILNAANDRTINLSLFVADPTIPCAAGVAVPGCDVKMVSSAPTNGWPVYWPTDGRVGGVPDPLTAGPSWIQIGNEAGFLANPAVIPAAPVGYEYNRRSITVLNISTKSLLMGPAERADVIVDFSAYAGKTLILYNDAPAPVPAFDSRYDYYTGDPDQSGMGGAPTTIPGYGPNTRTIMQIVVGAADGTSANVAALQAQLPAAFKASQPPPIVPQAAYSAAYGTPFTDVFARLQKHNLTFTPVNGVAPVTLPMQDKTIQELFELDYGRMNATLGTELPFTNFNNQTTVPLGYVDPPSEILTDSLPVAMQPVGTLGDGTQLWQITHNGVDTHTIHFHLFNVQLINRFGWDGTTRPPDPNEIGWKESVRMNPLEIDFVALRPMSQNLPWPLPDSVRPLDVTMQPEMFDPMMSLLNSIGGIADRINHTTNFGWEYVWHCHLLGHEENDMMRPMVLQVPPPTPNPLTAIANIAGGVDVTLTDNSASETSFNLQRDLDPNFPAPTTISVPASTPNTAFGGAISYTDTSINNSTQVYYRVQAVDGVLASGWSNTAPFIAAPIAGLVPRGPLAFGNQGVGAISPAQMVTLSNTGTAALTLSVALVSPDFAQSNTCGASLPPGANCAISVAFAPTNIGALTASLTITSNDPVNPLFTVSMTGTGIATTATAINAPAVNYGTSGVVTVSVTSSPASTVTGNVTVTVDGGTPLSQALANGAATFTLPTSLAVGTHALVADYAAQGFFQASTATGSLVVNGAPLTITASSDVMVYGGTVPTIIPSFTGFVNGDTSAVLTAQPICTTTATNASPVGTYPSSCSGAAATSYTITYVAGTTTVNPATLAITASSGSMPYGGPVPIVTPAFAGFMNGNTSAVLTTQPTCSMTATVTSPVSGSPYSTSCNGAVAANYTINYVAGTMTVHGAPLTITASANTMPYGGPVPTITSSFTGFVNGDTSTVLTTQPICSTTATVATGVGTHANANTCVGAVAANYTINYVAGTMTVTAVPLTITASNGAMTYGGLVPVITPGYLGFVAGDTPASLTTQPICSTSATRTSPVSGNPYPSICAGAVAANYTIAYVPGTVVVSKATSATVITSNLPNPSIVGQIVTVNFAVTPQFAGSVPSGTVVVTASTGESCTATLPVLGCNLIFNTGGPRTLTAAYVGDGNFLGSASAPVNQGVGGVSLSTTALLFGNQLVGTNSATQTITLANVGTTQVTITSIVSTNNADFNFTTTCGAILRVGRSCNIVVRFHPTATGVRTGTMTITDSDPTPQVVLLTGTGVAPVNQVLPGSLAFGNVPIRAISGSQVVTVSNPGTAPLGITRISLNVGNANQFSQNNNCPPTLAVGANCTVNVTFRPTTRGAKTTTLSVVAAAPAISQAVALTGTGQ